MALSFALEQASLTLRRPPAPSALRAVIATLRRRLLQLVETPAFASELASAAPDVQVLIADILAATHHSQLDGSAAVQLSKSLHHACQDVVYLRAIFLDRALERIHPSLKMTGADDAAD